MRGLITAALALVVAGCAGASPDPAAAPRQPKPPLTGDSSLVIRIENVRNSNGVLRVGLFDEDGFPDLDGQRKGVLVSAKHGKVSTKLKGLPAGTYAVAVYHDENANGELDTGFFGQPAEGVGFSRDAEATFGAPDFEDVAVKIGDKGETTLRITIRYWDGSEVEEIRKRQARQ